MAQRESESRHQHPHQHHHSAVDEVVNLLGKASRDLSVVNQHLQKEFQQSYPDNANPYKLVGRIKKIQEDLVLLKDLCRDLLAEKQELIDMASATLVGQKSSLQRLLASSGLPLMSESDNLVYTNLDQIIDEWKAHIKVKAGKENDAASEDLNSLLFSSIVQNT